MRRIARLWLERLEDRCTPTTLAVGFTESLIAESLSAPTSMAVALDGRIFVTQQGGAMRVIKDGQLLATPFVTLTVDSSGERGLLGVVFDPNYAQNRFVYAYYTTPDGGVHNRVSRFTANGDVAVPGSEVRLLDLEPLSAATNHNGGALHFGPDGKLYIAVGENGNGANAQSLATRLGKLLRINADGTIPFDNPFVNTPGARPEIYALGLRNPFTFAFQVGTGRLFINDVGQSTWEEIDDGVAGGNYGWPATEGPTTDPHFVAPLFAYQHVGTPRAIAITGGTFYNPAAATFPSVNVGQYFFADLGGNFIRRLDPASRQAVDFATGLTTGTPVDLDVDAAGRLLYLARGGGSNTGAVYRIAATGRPPLVVSTAVNGGTKQRSMVTSIAVTFSAVVTLPTNAASAFTLTRVGGGAVTVTASSQTVNGLTVVTLSSFSGAEASTGGSLNNGRYVLTGLAGNIVANGLPLDGNGNGAGGDNFVFSDSGQAGGLYRLYGDANGDRVVNAADLDLFRTMFGANTTDFTFDSNRDGVINATDLNVFRTTFGATV